LLTPPASRIPTLPALSTRPGAIRWRRSQFFSRSWQRSVSCTSQRHGNQCSRQHEALRVFPGASSSPLTVPTWVTSAHSLAIHSAFKHLFMLGSEVPLAPLGRLQPPPAHGYPPPSRGNRYQEQSCSNNVAFTFSMSNWVHKRTPGRQRADRSEGKDARQIYKRFGPSSSR